MIECATLHWSFEHRDYSHTGVKIVRKRSDIKGLCGKEDDDEAWGGGGTNHGEGQASVESGVPDLAAAE